MLRFSPVILDGDARVTDLRCLDDDVARSHLAGLSEVFLADLFEVAEPDILRVATHLIEDFSTDATPIWYQ